MAPCDYDDPSIRPANPHKLLHKFGLGRHVLPTLKAPHQIEGVVCKWLLQGVCHLEATLGSETLCLGYLVASGSL